MNREKIERPLLKAEEHLQDARFHILQSEKLTEAQKGIITAAIEESMYHLGKAVVGLEVVS